MGLLGVKENQKTLVEETGNPILNWKNGLILYSSSKDGEGV